jgi:malate dehydrogenase
MNNKISVIGAGMVGATLAHRVLESGMADVVMVDIARNIAAGKALDLSDASPVIGHERTIVGTDDYTQIKDSAVVVITAGFARKPGMSREDLIAKNAAIVKDVSRKIKSYSPQALVIVVTNPLDTMTYLAYKTTGFNREKVFGMAGLLDSSRFIYLISHELKVPRSAVRTLMLGSHGDTMVPVISKTTVSGKPVLDLMPKEKLDAVIKRTCDRGAEIVSLLGSGSAYYSPSASVFKMLDVIFGDKSEMLVVSAHLNGEYGLRDICIGVPCVLGKKGIERIIEIDLSTEEAAAFKRSAAAIKDSIDLL